MYWEKENSCCAIVFKEKIKQPMKIIVKKNLFIILPFFTFYVNKPLIGSFISPNSIM